MSVLRFFRLAGVVACFGYAGFSYSQSDDLMSLSLDELLQVKITGVSLIEEKQLYAPASVTVFTGEEIRQMGVESIEALMDYVPGFQSYQIGESGHSLPYSSRGRKVGTTSREVLVLLDGQRVDSTLYGGAAFAIPLLSTKSIERIEYMRGPGSSLYGTGSFLGTINIVTSKDARSYGAQVGSNQWRDAYLAASGEASGISYSLNLRRFQDEGERLAAYDPFSGPTMTRDPVEGDDVSLDLEKEGWGLSYRRSFRKADDYYVIATLKDGVNKYATGFESVSLRKSTEWSHDQRSQVSIGYKTWWEQGSFEVLPEGYLAELSEPSSPSAFELRTDLEEREWFGNVVHEWWFGNDRSLVFGGEWRSPQLEKVDAYNNYDLGEFVSGAYPVSYYGDFARSTPIFEKSKRDVVGGFLQLKSDIGNDWFLTAGLRYDCDSLVSSRVTPRLALVKDYEDSGFVLKLLYSEAFRSPSTVEMFSINNPVIVGNSNLKPEVVETLELVAVKEFDKQVISASLFDNRFNDSIVNGFVNGLRSFVNSEDEQNRGMEVEYRAQASEDLLLRATFTRFFSQPESTFREASSLASWSANYNLNRWNFNLGSSFHGARSMLTPVPHKLLELDSYWSTRGSIRYEVNESLDVYINILNALDEQILTPPQSESLVSGLENRGRQVRIGFDAEF